MIIAKYKRKCIIAMFFYFFMKTNTKILFSLCALFLFSGCSLWGGSEEASPTPVAPPLQTAIATPLPTPSPVKVVEKVTGAPDEQVDEYLKRVRDAQEKLQKKFETEPMKVLETPKEESPSPSVSKGTWFSEVAFAEELPIENSLETPIPSLSPESQGVAPPPVNPGVVPSSEMYINRGLQSPIPVLPLENLSTPELLTEMELNISLALEALESQKNPQELLILLQDVQFLQDEVLILLSEKKEANPELQAQIDEIKNSLQEISETVDITILEVEEAITSGEETFNVSFDTTIDGLPLSETGNYPLVFDRKMVHQKKRELLLTHINDLTAKLLQTGMSKEEVEEILSPAKATLTAEESDPGSLWKAIKEQGIVRILEKKGVTAQNWKTQKEEWSAQNESEKIQRQSKIQTLNEQVISGEMTKEQVILLKQEEQKLKREKKTNDIYEKIKEKNPEKAELFLEAQKTVSDARDAKKSLRGEKKWEGNTRVQNGVVPPESVIQITDDTVRNEGETSKNGQEESLESVQERRREGTDIPPPPRRNPESLRNAPSEEGTNIPLPPRLDDIHPESLQNDPNTVDVENSLSEKTVSEESAQIAERAEKMKQEIQKQREKMQSGE